MRINNNIMAMNTHRQLGINSNAGAKSIEKLSSGFRINRAGDDAAGLSISEKMRGQIRGLTQGSRNAQDSISLIQTAEGALNETHAILQRVRELAVQSASDTNTASDRSTIQDEVDQLTEEITKITDKTEFNTMKLLDGSRGAAVTAAVANITGNDSLNVGIATTTLATGLTNAAGASLGIAVGDTIEVSWVKNGSLQSGTVTVEATTSMGHIDAALTGGAFTYTGGVNLTAGTAGFAGAVNGLTITVKDSTGSVKTAATNALSSFEETTAAADVRADGSATFQIGANQGQNLNLSIENMSASALGVNSIQVSTRAQADIAIKVVDSALNKVSAERSKLGSVQNRLEHTIKNLDTSSENLQASESRIRDVDMAKEMMTFTKNNILQQAAQAMLAQANQAPQGVLQLLR